MDVKGRPRELLIVEDAPDLRLLVQSANPPVETGGPVVVVSTEA